MCSPAAEPEDVIADHRPESEVLVARPAMLVPLGWLLGVLLLIEAVHEVFGVGSPGVVLGLGIQGFLLVAAAVLCLARAAWVMHGRRAWLWVGVGLACWAIGSVFWDALYSADRHAPYPTAADALWLAWYPFTAFGLALLIRERIKSFELHRWMDGLAVMLVVLTPAVALIVQPVAENSTDSGLAAVVDFSYPILDVLMVGGILGVYGLLGWRPGRTWLLLGLGCAVIALADGVFSVQQARGGLLNGDYDFLWSGSALLIAAAAWSSAAAYETPDEVYGWRAIALPVAAQLCTAGIQVYAFFFAIGSSERFVTFVVLVVVTVQIILSRPRAPASDAE